MKEINQCQKIQFGLLKDFDRVCRENNWTYWLDGGTLLGAVRHQGFIPWDDDLDVMMPRKDFEEFRGKGQRCLADNIFLQNYKTDKYYDETLLLKLRDRNSTFIENCEKDWEVPYHQGIYIDIFPMDTVKRGTHKKILKLFSVYRYLLLKGKIIFLMKPETLKRKILRFVLSPILHVVFHDMYHYTLFVHDMIFKHYMKKYVCGQEDAVYFKPFACNQYPQIVFEKEDLFPLKEAVFEGSLFPVPANAHKYLALQYGDYMKMPPLEKRTCHSYSILPDTPCNHPESTKRKGIRELD
jgi:lipopolysaccharide cholinephosphotransferase